MITVFDLIDQGEFLSLIFIAVLLYLVGQMAISNSSQLMKWGYGISLLGFIVYVLIAVKQHGAGSAESILSIISRGLIAAGMLLGSCWILFSALAFLIAPVKHWKHSLQNSQRELQRKKEQELATQAEEETRRNKQQEWERAAPERENQQRLKKQTEQQRIEHQHRREAARLDCQLFYDQHAPQLQERFPRERISEYFEQYLCDLFPAELVENRAKQLIGMIESSLEQAGGNKQRFASLIEIASYFEQQKQEIMSLNYDGSTRQSFLSSLALQEDQAIREFLSS